MTLKKNELRNMQESEINKNLVELGKELMKLRSQASRGTPPENPGRIRAIKRTVARMLTKLNSEKKFVNRTDKSEHKKIINKKGGAN